MANEAAKMPAGVDATLYDFGRAVALWVSAFEILTRSADGIAGVNTVYPLLEGVTYINPNLVSIVTRCMERCNRDAPFRLGWMGNSTSSGTIFFTATRSETDH